MNRDQQAQSIGSQIANLKDLSARSMDGPSKAKWAREIERLSEELRRLGIPDGTPFVPAAEEAEACLLGVILGSEQPEDLLEQLSVKLFNDERHKVILEAMRSSQSLPGGICVPNLDSELRKQGANGATIASYALHLPAYTYSAANWEAWLGKVKNASEQREDIAILEHALSLRRENKVSRSEFHRYLAQATEALGRDLVRPVGLPAFEDFAELSAEDLLTPPALVDGLIRLGEKAVLGGQSKSFKSWAALDLALSVSHGIPWLGWKVTKGKVLVVNLELARWTIRRRLLDIASARGITISEGCLILLNLRGQSVTAREIRATLARRKIPDLALVVIDPAYKLLHGRDENAAGDIASLMAEFEAITAETGAAVVVPTHFAKGNAAGKEAMDRISGSGVFARDPDTVLTLTRHEEEGAFTVESVLRSFPPIQPFVIRWNHPVFDPDTSLDPAQLRQPGRPGPSPAVEDDKVLNLIPPAGISKPAWRSAADEAFGISKSGFYRIASRLEDSGKVSCDGTGVCKRTVRSCPVSQVPKIPKFKPETRECPSVPSPTTLKGGTGTGQGVKDNEEHQRSLTNLGKENR